jgi:hypothetical protein
MRLQPQFAMTPGTVDGFERYARFRSGNDRLPSAAAWVPGISRVPPLGLLRDPG